VLPRRARQGNRVSRLSALDSTTYRQFLLASLAGSLGGWIAGTAQGWLVLDLTGSSAALGWTSAAGWLPFLLLSPLAGVLADRVDARSLIIWTRVVIAFCASILAVLVGLGGVSVWLVIVIAFVAGCAYALAAPAMQAMVGSLVRSTEIGTAVALNSGQFNLARVIGPLIAGIAVAAGGIALAFWGNAIGAVTALFAFRRLPVVRRQRAPRQSMLSSLGEGVMWLRSRPDLFALVLLTGAPALLTLNYTVLLPVFARNELGSDAAGLGVLAAGAGVGALSGALIVAIGRPAGGSGRLMLMALSTMTVGVLLFSLSSWFLLSLIALVLVGGAQVAYFATANTLLQTQVPPPVLGRVLSLYAIVSQGLIPVGNVAIGELADGTSPRIALGGAAVSCLALTAAVAWFVPDVRGLRGRSGMGANVKGGEVPASPSVARYRELARTDSEAEW